MTERFEFAKEDLAPDRTEVLRNQGVPPGAAVPGGIEAIYAAAIGLLQRVAVPTGVLAELSRADFANLYRGEGRNESPTPVEEILDRVDDLALFAVTLGPQVSREIETRFVAGDYALGSMLDAAASAAADRLGAVAERRFLETLARTGRARPDTAVLRYSPGYCGWHISGQKKLFEFLQPERVGICLNDSFLMRPLKSVSGVLLAGPREIHDFRTSYSFCDECKTRGCRARIRALLAG